jgi:outer membrane protein
MAEEELNLALTGMSMTIDLRARANQAYDPNTFFEEQRYFDVSANLKVPLYKGGKDKSNIRKFREKLTKSNYNMNNTLREESEKAMIIWNKIQSLNSQIISFKSSILANKIALEGVVQEENVGARTVIDVLDAENELFRAKANLIKAKTNLYIASYEILEVTGNMNAKYLNLPVSTFHDSNAYYNKVIN